MKNYIIYLIFLIAAAGFENLYSFDSSKVEINRGNFYFLTGTEGKEKAIMYLHIEETYAYGSYYTSSESIEFSGTFENNRLNLTSSSLTSSLEDNYKDPEHIIIGNLSEDIVFKGKHNSKNINLSLANVPVNTLKIFSYFYDDYQYYCKDIINPKYYNERELINSHNSQVSGTVEEENMYIPAYVYNEEHRVTTVSYIDDRIIILEYDHSFRGGGGGLNIHLGYGAYPINSKFENGIELSDFLINTKDRKLFQLIIDKFKQDYTQYHTEEEWLEFVEYNYYSYFDDINYYDFYISENGTISFYCCPESYSSSLRDLTATFTFEELKPFIKKGSVLEYLFN